MLISALQQLAATGPSGFEGLIQRLLERLTGYQFYLAQSGSQAGRDMSSERVNATVLAVECKRYGDETELKISELLGKLVQAVETIPKLDVWVLVASRAVPDQVYSELQHLAERLQVDVQVLSAGDGSPSSLEVLCANGRDDVVSDLRSSRTPNVRAIEKELDRITADPAFLGKCDRVKALFTTGAGYDATRQRLRGWLIARFSSDANARAAFGQPVGVEASRAEGRLVPRIDVSAKLDAWLGTWRSERRGIAVLGEEGDGKTWAVASWLSSKFYSDAFFPQTLWLPSRELVSQDVEALIGDALAKRLGRSSRTWVERLHRWSTSEGSIPPMLVVFDGINERHDSGWWRQVIETLGADPWRGSIAPILTARTGFWPSIARLPHISWADCRVPPFDDSELDLALRQVNVRREELPDDILKLVRKPRYFDLAVRHRKSMAESGDVTVARLVYEDWRDRESRRVGLPGETDFQDVIMGLALKHAQGRRTLVAREVSDAVRTTDNREALLVELQTGGVLVRDGRHWRVDPDRLALGFGLLLAERLRENESTTEPEEVLASLLEPQPDIDLKGTILEHAALHSLETASFPKSIRSLLLTAWVTHRNQRNLTEHSVSAYFPLDPSAYLDAAERVWAGTTNDGWAERLFRSAYGRWSSTQPFVDVFARAFERWLGFVHVDGSPIGVRPEDRPLRRAAMTSIRGSELSLGPFEYAGHNFTAIDDDDLLRLGRLALALISGGDRRPHIRAITTAIVGDALMQWPDRLDLCRWIIRTSTDDLWPLIEPEARRLMTIGSRTTQEAAYRMLGSVGTAHAIGVRSELSEEELFPRPAWFREHEADPCVSGFSWRREECARCAGRDDVPVHLMAQQLQKCVQNPDFEVPSVTRERLLPFLTAIDTSQIWSRVSTTEQEHRFETIEPALASGNPEALADFVRAIARQVANRRGMPLRQLAYQLLSYRLVLSGNELKTIRETWVTLRSTDEIKEQENERAEWTLFELAIQDLPAPEQLTCLLARDRDALVLTRFLGHFKPIGWSAINERLGRAADSSEISRILFFASAHRENVDAAASDTLSVYVNHPDRLVRLLAFELIKMGNLEGAGAAIVGGEWHFKGLDDTVHEDHWGSLILATWGTSLPYEELRTRIAPTVLGQAISNRGRVAREVEQFAADLDRTWNQLGIDTVEQEGGPAIEVRIGSVKRTDDLDLPSVDSSAFSRTTIFASRHASWGGHVDTAPSTDFIKGLSDDDFEKMHEGLRNALHSQREARNFWFAQRFDSSCLAEVVRLRPDLVAKWLGDPIGGGDDISKRVWLARSFYEALCEVLLSEDPKRGATLYVFLSRHSAGVRFIEDGTGIPVLDHALFDAKDCKEVRELWHRRLDEARSDRELLILSVTAQRGNAASWLADMVAKDVASHVPLVKARALLLRGFINSSEVPPEPMPQVSDVIEWHREQSEKALKNWRSNQWAQTWFHRFTSALSDDVAVGAYRLFLSCVDSRFSLWSAVALEGAPEHRRRFVVTSQNEIITAIRKNDDRLSQEFLGMKVAKGQVWPWL